MAETKPANDFIEWPAHWPRYHNARNYPCDMLIGPCACGGWHQEGEFVVKDGTLHRYGQACQTYEPKEPTNG